MNIVTQNHAPFSINNVEVMRIDGVSGNVGVGIGKTAPAYAMDVSGLIASSGGTLAAGMGVASGVGSHGVYIVAFACTPCVGSAPGVLSSITTQIGFASSSAGVESERYGLYILPGTSGQYIFWRTSANFVSGTYTFSLDYAANPDRGIMTLKIDDVTAGTIDMYASTTTQGFGQITNISIPSTKVCKIEMQINTKNASSSNYYFIWRRAGFFKTA
jgi:hypothetical protein